MDSSSSVNSSQARLERLVARRVERKLMSETGTPVPEQLKRVAEQEVQSSLRRHHRAAQVIDTVVSQLRSGSLQSATPQPTTGGTPALSRPVPAWRSTPEPYLPFKKAPTPLLPQYVDGPQEDMWAALAKQAAVEATLMDARAAAERALKIQQQKQILDDQVRLRQRRFTERHNELVQDRQATEVAAVEWHADQKAAAEQRRDIAKQIKADREAQAQARREKRAQEKINHELQERAILERIQQELTVEAKRAHAIKERDVRFREELIAANEAQKRIKQEREAVLAAEEAGYVKLYDERLRRQEEARSIAWNQVKAKMAGREATAFNLAATLQDKAAEDDRKAAIVTAERERAAEAKKQQELEQRRLATAIVRECQVEQIALKRDREMAHKTEYSHELEETSASVQRDREAMRQEREAKIRAQIQQRALLEEQILVKQNQRFIVMSEEEKKLNSRLLSRTPSNSPPR